MKTIIYQGQPVEVELVNYLSGTIPTSTVDAYGDEELFRDSQGRYYLRRQLELLADYHEDQGEGNIPASGRTLVHRINVNAAILWATTRLNSERLDLRRDAAKLLMESRGYIDPNPVHLSASQRQELAATGEASARMVEVARLRQRRDEIETRMDEIDAGAVDTSVGSLRRERNAINERIEALEGLGDGGPLLTFTLDTYGSTLVRRALAEGDALRGIDIVNGALRYTLGADNDHNWPEEAKKAAARREAQSPSGVRRDAIPTSATQHKLVLAGVCANGLEGKTVCLDWEPGEALPLVKQYQAESGHEVEHIVNAAVEYALGMIFDKPRDRETWDEFAERVAKVATRIMPTVGEPRESVPPAQVSAARYAADLGAALAWVRAQIDAVDQAEGEDAAADLRTLHVDLFNALRRFGQVFAVDVRTLLRVPVEMDGKIVQPPPIPDSERDVYLDAKAAALVNRYSEK